MTNHYTKETPSNGPNRLTCLTADGKRTTASMPASEKARYVAAFGGARQFRRNFNDAIQSAQPRPGLSRSMAVRLILDRQLEQSQS